MENDIRDAIARLQARGWTISTVGEAIQVTANTVAKWKGQARYPAHPQMVLDALAKLEVYEQIPKKKRGRPRKQGN